MGRKDIKNRIIAFILLLAVILTAVPAMKAEASEAVGRIEASELNVRKGPSTEYEKVQISSEMPYLSTVRRLHF